MIFFSKTEKDKKFVSKKIKKNFEKKVVYKETIITSSLYSSAINLELSQI